MDNQKEEKEIIKEKQKGVKLVLLILASFLINFVFVPVLIFLTWIIDMRFGGVEALGNNVVFSIWSLLIITFNFLISKFLSRHHADKKKAFWVIFGITVIVAMLCLWVL